MNDDKPKPADYETLVANKVATILGKMIAPKENFRTASPEYFDDIRVTGEVVSFTYNGRHYTLVVSML